MTNDRAILRARTEETMTESDWSLLGVQACGVVAHFPVGADGEFHWEDGTKVGT